MENTPKPKTKRRIGRPPKHGARAIVYRADLIREYPEVVRLTRDWWDGMVADLGGPAALTTAQEVLLSRVISKVQTAALIEIWLGKHGILRRDSLDRKLLEAEPIVATWLSINNAIRADLQLLGIKRVETADPEPSLLAYIAAKKKLSPPAEADGAEGEETA